MANDWTVANFLRKRAEETEESAKSAQRYADEMAERLEEQRDSVKNLIANAKKLRAAADQLDALDK